MNVLSCCSDLDSSVFMLIRGFMKPPFLVPFLAIPQSCRLDPSYSITFPFYTKAKLSDLPSGYH